MSTYNLKINGKQYNVTVNSVEGNNASVNVNGVDYNVEIEGGAAPVVAPVAAPVAAPAAAPATPAPAPAAAPAGGKSIVSPLPGVIISVDVKEGQAIKRGQKVAVIEAMKMENEILAEFDGTVTAIHVSKGDSVLEDAKIVTIS